MTIDELLIEDNESHEDAISNLNESVRLLPFDPHTNEGAETDDSISSIQSLPTTAAADIVPIAEILCDDSISLTHVARKMSISYTIHSESLGR